MEVVGSKEKMEDPNFPLPSFRLLVPPLQLLSAAMWNLMKGKDVMNYGKLQEFVSMLTEAVPGLINHRQRAHLLLGLRARLILELCKGSARRDVDSDVIQTYLEGFPVTSATTDTVDTEVRTTECTFIALVQSLLKDPAERAYFFQEVFPVEYGPQYDSALQVLLWELLSKLEMLLPVPDLKQTTAWLSSAPSVLEECVQPSPEELSSVFKHYNSLGLLKMMHGPSCSIGSCIMSALSVPPSQKTNIAIEQELIHNYANALTPVTLGGAGHFSVVAYCADMKISASEVDEAEVQVQTEYYEEEIMALSVENTGGEDANGSKAAEMSETAGVAKALETLTKTFSLRKERLGQDALTGQSSQPPHSEELGPGGAAEEGGMNEIPETRQTDAEVVQKVRPDASKTNPNLKENWESECETQKSDVCRSTRLQQNTSQSCQEMWNVTTPSRESNEESKMNPADVPVAPSVIAIKGTEKGDSDEMISIIFTCSQCPFHNSEENSPPHFHMQNVGMEEYRSFSGGAFTPSPSSSDEIFTSIKLFPKGNTEQDNVEPDHDSQTHSRQKSLTCKTCGRVFTRTSDVRRHQLTHTGERPFHCSQCDRTFQHSWDLSKHQSKHHGVAISFSCQLCGSSFPKLRALTIHHRKSHSQESQLPQICSICSQSSPTASELLEHRKTHTTTNRYLCEQCGEGFDSLLARSQHRRVHRVMRQFKCPHCEKTYTRRSDVKRHLAIHTGERPYQCTQCSKRFPVRFMLTKHLRVHTGERPFQCSHCSKRFTLVSVLARHERMHTGEKPFLCSQCGKGFLSQGELLKHHRSHMDDRPYACPQCDKRFKSKTSQQQHIVSHSGTRPYPCTVCGKCFTKPYALTRHNLVHTGERPFPCGHCEKSFLTLSEARLHQRIHTGERPYHCSVCELRFRSSSELARHKRCHSGSKRVTLSCEPSGKTFASTAKLKEHMETHDGAEAAPTANSSESCSSVVSRV
uniref:C2H2-type domain-containing protein n=2 Tax=Nothobranchius rachovii TaxID=451742 RepID=A0A1A8R788_9TELE